MQMKVYWSTTRGSNLWASRCWSITGQMVV